MLVYSILDVSILRVSVDPPTYFVHATGHVLSTGWINAKLVTRQSDANDPLLDLQFEADAPSGVTLPVLVPLIATLVLTPKNQIDAIIVHARTNQVTSHVTEYQSDPRDPSAGLKNTLTTLRLGEESSSNPRVDDSLIAFREPFTKPPVDDPQTKPRWEDERMMFGGEGPFTKPPVDDPSPTKRRGEEDPMPDDAGGGSGGSGGGGSGSGGGLTTLALGEEGPFPPLTTFQFGEESNPATTQALGEEGGLTTLAIGEEGSWNMPNGGIRINPPFFGGFGGF